jgi:glycylpeptide N-tetradecanoyltransferase
MLNEYLKSFTVKLHLTKKEVSHMLLPREGVVYSYVIEDPDKKDITDFFSFYSLPSTVIKPISGYDKVNVISQFI